MSTRMTAHERFSIDLAVRYAEQLTRHEYSVFVGAAPGDVRTFATALHGALVTPDRSVLLLVEPEQRRFEVVTGAHVRKLLPDGVVERVVESAGATFADADLVSAIVRAVRDLASATAVTERSATG